MFPPVKIGLLADTHGVYDPAAAEVLRGSQIVLHAGDVGNHGGHEELLQQYAKGTCTSILAVAGNVDDKLDAVGRQMLPEHRVVTIAGWKILLTHIVATGPQAKVAAAATRLLELHQPDIIVFGHSHKASSWQSKGVCYINPGSAGPARFKLPRSVATLLLPRRSSLTSDSTAAERMVIEVNKACIDMCVCPSDHNNSRVLDTTSTPVHSIEQQPLVEIHFLGQKAPGRSRPK